MQFILQFLRRLLDIPNQNSDVLVALVTALVWFATANDNSFL